MIILKLDEMLDKRNMTAYALHKVSGLHQSVISKIRHNKSKALQLDVLDKLCESLECLAGDLIVYQGKDATQGVKATQSAKATQSVNTTQSKPKSVKGESVKETTAKPVRVAKVAATTQSAESRRRERLPALSGGDKWISLVEAGELLGKKRKSVNDDVNKHRLPVEKIDKRNYVKKSDVIAFRDSRNG